MKKILYIISLIIFTLIIILGFVNINIENTKVFNDKDKEVVSIDHEKLKEDIGMDLTIFSKDNSAIKIYKENSSFVIVFNDYIFDLSDSILGNLIVSVLDVINSGTDTIKNFIDLALTTE